jgi:GntR family transcriptional regulator
LFIKINTSSGVPIYRQISDQVKVAVATGTLSRGEQLPSVRGLSEALVINPTTVQRAYMDLERDGVIETRRGQGTFVTGDGAVLPAGERRRRAQEHLRNALAEARRLRVDRAELTRIFTAELSRIFGCADASGEGEETDND